MKRAERMRKARMFRRLISEISQTELANAPQTLKFRRINQTHEKFAFFGVGFQPNDVVNRIAVYFFGQFISPYSETLMIL